MTIDVIETDVGIGAVVTITDDVSIVECNFEIGVANDSSIVDAEVGTSIVLTLSDDLSVSVPVVETGAAVN